MSVWAERHTAESLLQLLFARPSTKKYPTKYKEGVFQICVNLIFYEYLFRKFLKFANIDNLLNICNLIHFLNVINTVAQW